MRTLVLLMVLTVFISSCSNKAENGDVPSDKLLVDFSETIRDFGVVTIGSKARHKFEFTNVSNTSISITNVRASCTCLFPNTVYTETSISPGGKGYVEFQGSTGERGIKSIEQLYITFSDGERTQEKKLDIRNRTTFGMVTDLTTVNFSVVSSTDLPIKKPLLLIYFLDESPDFKINKIYTSDDFIHAEVSSEPVNKWKSNSGNFMMSVKLIVTLDELPVELNEINGFVTIETNHPYTPKLTVPVVAMIAK